MTCARREARCWGAMHCGEQQRCAQCGAIDMLLPNLLPNPGVGGGCRGHDLARIQ